MNQDNFYEKLMLLKREHEQHLKLVERVYINEAFTTSQVSNTSKNMSKPGSKVMFRFYFAHAFKHRQKYENLKTKLV